MRRFLTTFILLLAACLGGVTVPVLAAETNVSLSPGALQRSIELETRRLAAAPGARRARLSERAQQPSAADNAHNGPSHKKVLAIALGVAGLTAGTIGLVYGYSDACRTNHPSEENYCEQSRYTGLTAVIAAGGFLPIAFMMK